MDFTLREYAEAKAQEEHQASRYHEGMRVAYEDIAMRLNPTLFCQDCGKEYDDDNDRISHEAQCEDRKKRLNPSPRVARSQETEKENGAKEQARAQLDSIVQMVKRLEHCQKCSGGEDCELSDKEIIESFSETYVNGEKVTKELKENYHDEEDAEQALDEDPLSIEVRGGWHNPGEENKMVEYAILLCTGGPAVRITGELENCEPKNARLQYQDWGTPWTEYFDFKDDERDLLLEYAQHFYFEE